MVGSRHQKAQGPPARQNVDLSKLPFEKIQNSSAVGNTTPTQNSRAVSVSGVSNPNTALSLSAEARDMDVVSSFGIGGAAQASVPSTSAGTCFDFRCLFVRAHDVLP